MARNLPGVVAVRDSTDPHGPTLVFTLADWAAFGLGSRALDLITPAFDCMQLGDYAAADRLLARATAIAGYDGLRCLVSYQALGGLAYLTRENDPAAAAAGARVITAVLDRLDTAR